VLAASILLSCFLERSDSTEAISSLRFSSWFLRSVRWTSSSSSSRYPLCVELDVTGLLLLLRGQALRERGVPLYEVVPLLVSGELLSHAFEDFARVL